MVSCAEARTKNLSKAEGMGMAPSAEGMGMVPCAEVMGMVPCAEGMGMAPSAEGMGMVPCAAGMGMVPCAEGMGGMPCAEGMGMVPCSGSRFRERGCACGTHVCVRRARTVTHCWELPAVIPPGLSHHDNKCPQSQTP